MLNTPIAPQDSIYLFHVHHHKQANGFELTCGAVSMRARFAHDIELLPIYEMHFQTADCLDKRARACRDGRLSELLGCDLNVSINMLSEILQTLLEIDPVYSFKRFVVIDAD